MLILRLLILLQLSPGDLHEAHKELEGLKNCAACHELGTKNFQPKCLACHTLIKDKIEAKAGFHGQMTELACQTCHKDHFGRDFKLVHWPDGQDQFDHTATGFQLNGAHSKIECRTCHQERFIQNLSTLLDAGKKTDRTFFGLSSSCASCHGDVHDRKLGSDCSACHDESSWRPAPGFDHAQLDFPLQGAHQKLACEACHKDYKSASDSPVLSSRLEWQTCAKCHKDRHMGQFTQDCSHCHTPDSWKPPRAFNHDRARFALTGAHRKTDCSKCHPALNGDRKYRGLPHENCSACHEDLHQGRLGNRCDRCHTPQSWNDYRTAEFDHSATGFALRERHSEISCKDCHRNRASSQISKECSSCHRNIHDKQFQTFSSRDCESCHNERSFQQAKFSQADHAKTAFPLKGAHLATACQDCHRQEPTGFPQFNLRHDDCQSCHRTPHENGGQFHAQLACSACHAVKGWKTSQFDHSSTGLALQGAHKALSCRQCHQKPLLTWQKEPRPSTSWTDLSHCSSCHADPHKGQFERACNTCHVPSYWKPDLFNHGNTRFPLDGAHEQLACSQCHFKESETIRYKPITPTCQACHGRNGSQE